MIQRRRQVDTARLSKSNASTMLSLVLCLCLILGLQQVEALPSTQSRPVQRTSVTGNSPDGSSNMTSATSEPATLTVEEETGNSLNTMWETSTQQQQQQEQQQSLTTVQVYKTTTPPSVLPALKQTPRMLAFSTKKLASPLASSKLQQLSRSMLLPSWTLQQVQLLMVSLFMGVSGSFGAICFRCFQAYPNMMTGNTIRFLDAIVDFRWRDVALSASGVGAYVLGGMVYKAMDIRFKQQQQKQLEITKNQQDPTIPLPATLNWTARWALVAFCASDIVARLVCYSPEAATASTATSALRRAWILEQRFWQLPFLSLAFGMINAAASDAFSGVTTNAVTGHWTKLALGTTEVLLLQATDARAISKETLRTSFYGMGSFFGALLITSMAMQWTPLSQFWKGAFFLPPLGASLGLVHLALFQWYSKIYRHKDSTANA